MAGGDGGFDVREPIAKTTKLYLPNGGWHFWSRQAYGLGYACQREDRLGRLQLGQPPDQAEVDALANLRAEIRTLGASGRESPRGVYDTRRAPVEVDVGSSVPPQRNASRLFGQAWAGR
jgi:hypothetical protein